jgi:multiphosphoryl transfer protein
VIGIVVVSHSAPLAEGVVELARQMGGGGVPIEAAGGVDDPEHPIGTDATRVQAALERLADADGVLVLMDLGSAVLSAELALELVEPDLAARVLLSDAPLVEGAVAAAVAARVGGSLEEVAAEARRGLRPKAAQLGAEEAPAEAPAASEDDDGGWVEARIAIPNPLGLHARPAARFVTTAGSFDAEVLATNLTTGAGPARARSLTEVATLGARQGHELGLRARGPQADAALGAIADLAARGFDEQEGPPPAPPAPGPPPVALARPGEDGLRGLPASPGAAVGRVRRLRRAPAPGPRTQGDPAAEAALLESALERARADLRVLRDTVARQAGEAHAAMLDAQLVLLEDEALLEPARAGVAGGAAAEQAWIAAVADAAARFAALDDPYMRARAEDVRELGRRVAAHLGGLNATPVMRGRGILVARELGAAETAALDTSLVDGIAVATGSPTSHSAILARALGVPAVVAVGDNLLTVAEETLVLLDGDSGVITIEPPPDRVAAAEERRLQRARDLEAGRAEAALPAETRDGVAVEVAANITHPDEAAAAVAAGADAVGLFRTEFLFMGRDRPPDEAEQEAAYRAAAEALGGRRLILRTLDAGADKPIPYLHQAAEENPFLGMRGIRISLAHPELFRTQLRAVLRVAADHRVAVMFPMVATAAELRAALHHLEAASEALAAERIAAGRPEAGVMVEVPAAALAAGVIGELASFLSIGSNDLTQYALAAERGNPAVAGLSDPLHPAVLALVEAACRGAAAHGCWVGVCGEAAGDDDAVPLLVGLGVRELSVAPPRIGAVKRAVRALDTAWARDLAEQALRLEDAAAVRRLVRERLAPAGP